jgi:general secretion pathway protein I
MPKAAPSTNSTGFTLLEMLVAVTVLAIAMGAILLSLSRYTVQAAYLRDKTLATWVAHNRLNEIQLDPSLSGTGNGESELAGATWNWQVQRQETQDPELVRVDVLVYAPGQRAPTVGDKNALLTLTGFVRK